MLITNIAIEVTVNQSDKRADRIRQFLRSAGIKLKYEDSSSFGFYVTFEQYNTMCFYIEAN